MTDADALPPTPRRRPVSGLALLAFVVLVGGVWSGLWLLGRQQADAALDRWISAEAAHGRNWTCPARAVAGFPFALHLHCTKPTFHGEIAGRLSSADIEEVDAGLDLFHPTRLAVMMRGPLVLRADDDEYKMLASWESLQATSDLFSGDHGGALTAERLALTISPQGGDDLNLRAGHLEGSATRTGDDAGWAFAASGVSFPTVDAFTGTQEPFEASGRGRLIDAALLPTPTAARLEAWRRAGGRLEIADLTLAKGEFRGRANGTLSLDADHRPSGRLDASLEKFGPIAEKLGIPVAGVKIGGLLTSLLSGQSAPVQPLDADAVRLPLVMADGHLSVGVFQVPVRLDPFY